jgi:hypothetical protein
VNATAEKPLKVFAGKVGCPVSLNLVPVSVNLVPVGESAGRHHSQSLFDGSDAAPVRDLGCGDRP